MNLFIIRPIINKYYLKYIALHFFKNSIVNIKNVLNQEDERIILLSILYYLIIIANNIIYFNII